MDAISACQTYLTWKYNPVVTKEMAGILAIFLSFKCQWQTVGSYFTDGFPYLSWSAINGHSDFDYIKVFPLSI